VAQGSIAAATNGDLAMTIEDLMQQIEETERLISVYRNANPDFSYRVGFWWSARR
jgi:hypothetical protein